MLQPESNQTNAFNSRLKKTKYCEDRPKKQWWVLSSCLFLICTDAFYVHNIDGKGIIFSGRRSDRPLLVITAISRYAMSLYLVKGFQWNLAQIFIMWVS